MTKCENDFSVLMAFSDPNVGVVLSEYLRLRGMAVELCSTVSETFNLAGKSHYDFYVLGLESHEELLQLTTDLRRISDTPMFVVQSVFNKEEQVALYEAGADDCIVQPLVPDLLICKMQAMLKRWNEFEKRLPTVYDYPDVHFDSVTQQLTVGEQTFHLSTKENGVLLLLCRNENQLLERSRILKEVWLADSYFNSRSLAVYINRLRHMIEPGSSLRIMSMRTRGYKLLT